MTAFNLLRNNAGLISLGILLALLSTAVTLLQPALVGQLISGVSSGAFQQPLMLLLLTILGTSVLTAATMYVVSIAADRTVRDLRKKITNHLLYLQMREFEKRGCEGFLLHAADVVFVHAEGPIGLPVQSASGFGVVRLLRQADWRVPYMFHRFRYPLGNNLEGKITMAA
ncbi:ABC transporter transmembrane domain-containing protein [Corynebacterium rouxii]|uniref:ABC transporter transmembrane domain-containing protein n=1 Tax=Corynebacterium rouxii TaxID=2719119 RepID=UPI003CF68145